MKQTKLLTTAAKSDIQGFITSAYGHLPYTAYLFIEIHDRSLAQEWLKKLLPRLTTATSWRGKPDEDKAKPERAVNIAISYTGMAAFGLSEAALHTFPVEFRQGMSHADRSRILGDSGESAPDRWEMGGPVNGPIHAMLILHAPDPHELDSFCDEEREEIRITQGGVIEHEDCAQSGARPVNGREHFGFFDGIAQPKIEGIKGERRSNG